MFARISRISRIALILGIITATGLVAIDIHDAWADDPPAVTTVTTGSAATDAAPATEKHVCTLDGKQVECSELADHPQESASEVTKLWKGGAMVDAIIVALFVLLTWASKHIDWLETGKRAAYTATGLTFLTVLVEPASRGTTPTLSMLLSAAGAAALFFMSATKKPKTAAPSA